MAGQQRGVGENDAVTHSTVMRHVTRRHEKTFRADHRESAAVNRTIDRHMLTNHRARANVNARGRCPVKLQVLWISTKHGKRMHHDAFAQNAMSRHDCMRLDLTPITELRARFNDRRRMNRGTHSSDFRPPSCVPLGKHIELSVLEQIVIL